MNQFQSTNAEIIVIDDEANVRAEVIEILGDEGYDCHEFDSAESARQGMAERNPDLIISDINLDGESGLELCRELKKTYDLAHVPVIFLSGAEIPNIIRRAHAAGGSYYLRKPFDPSVLNELVDKALWLPHVAGAYEVGSKSDSAK